MKHGGHGFAIIAVVFLFHSGEKSNSQDTSINRSQPVHLLDQMWDDPGQLFQWNKPNQEQKIKTFEFQTKA